MNNYNLMKDALLHPHGRIGRLSLIAWLTILAIILFSLNNYISLNIYISLQMLNTDVDFNQIEPLALFLWAILHLSCIYTFFIFIIRRRHDLNRSGWWSVLILIPIVQVIFLFLILVMPGSFHDNQYGHNRVTLFWEKIIAVMSMLCTPIVLSSCIFWLYHPPHKRIHKLNLKDLSM